MLTGLLPPFHPPRQTTRFSGWRIVVLAAIAMGMTAPGQTFGVSVFVDPMMAALGVTRSQVSFAYLIGTLGGATMMPRIGRLIDDRGSRVAMTLVAGCFGLVLTAMSGVMGLVTLVLGFTGIRMLGQGGLSLVATTSVAPWFERRRGFAVGVTAALGSTLMASYPLLAATVIGAVGWRWAWVVAAGLVWLIVLPVAVRGMIDRPRDVGQQVDGAPDPEPGTEPAEPVGWREAFTRGQAVRTAMFWAMAGGVAATGMIGTGLTFHQIDLLGEQGLTPIEAAVNFLPQMVASLTATLVIGSMVDRFSPRWVLALAMTQLAAAMVMVPLISPGLLAAVYGMLVGAAGSSVRALEAASFPKMFGLRHLGSIRGVVTSVSVASTAFGPLALSIGRDLTGSYVQVLLVLLVVPLGVTLLGFIAPLPTPPVNDPDPGTATGTAGV